MSAPPAVPVSPTPHPHVSSAALLTPASHRGPMALAPADPVTPTSKPGLCSPPPEAMLPAASQASSERHSWPGPGWTPRDLVACTPPEAESQELLPQASGFVSHPSQLPYSALLHLGPPQHPTPSWHGLTDTQRMWPPLPRPSTPGCPQNVSHPSPPSHQLILWW